MLTSQVEWRERGPSRPSFFFCLSHNRFKQRIINAGCEIRLVPIFREPFMTSPTLVTSPSRCALENRVKYIRYMCNIMGLHAFVSIHVRTIKIDGENVYCVWWGRCLIFTYSFSFCSAIFLPFFEPVSGLVRVRGNFYLQEKINTEGESPRGLGKGVEREVKVEELHVAVQFKESKVDGSLRM